MSLPVTGFYAGLLALGFVLLSLRVIRARRGHRVALGTGGKRPVERAMRAHGNFAEYVPLALLLLALLELNGLPTVILHALGLMLLGGRLAHAHGIAREPEVFRWRVLGMALTFTVLGLAGAGLVVLALLPR